MDGALAEACEGLGGLLFPEARDLNHTIGLLSRHRWVRDGAFEFRAAVDPTTDRLNPRR